MNISYWNFVPYFFETELETGECVMVKKNPVPVLINHKMCFSYIVVETKTNKNLGLVYLPLENCILTGEVK